VRFHNPHRSLRAELLVSAAMMAAPAVASAQVFTTFQASGANPAGIQTTVDAYRTALFTANPSPSRNPGAWCWAD